MRMLKRILTILIALIVVLACVSFVFPRQVKVERSIEIDAPISVVFAQLNGLKSMADWSPWLGSDPDIKLDYSGPETGVGAKLVWSSDHPNVGSGAQEIIEMVENEKVVSELDFGARGAAIAAFTFDDVGGKTNVTWSLETDMGASPVGRYMGLLMDRMVGADYEKGLESLKAMIEANG